MNKKLRHHYGRTTGTIVLCALFLQSCSALRFIPGLDRIFHKNSTAQVGPLINRDGNEELAPADPDFDSENKLQDTTETVLNMVEEQMESQPPPKPKAIASSEPEKPSLPVSEVASAPKEQTPIAASPQRVEIKSELTPPVARATGALRGSVIIDAGDGSQFGPEGTLIRLVPQFDYSPVKTKPMELKIAMEDKEYKPGYITANKSDLLTFVNEDPIKHNVFSPSGKNAFDLGTYGPKLERSVRLNDAGIAKVYCNIHAEMVTFVAIAEPGMSAKVDPKGDFLMPSLPSGEYLLHAWNIRGEFEQKLNITAANTTDLQITIDGSQPVVEEHTNKHGEKYEDFSKRFGREFY